MFGHRREALPLPPLEASAVLDKVVELPLSVWRYYSEPPGVLHLGPMAQDFRQAFGLGARDDEICVVDAVGVALASIQALHGKLEHVAGEQAGRAGLTPVSSPLPLLSPGPVSSAAWRIRPGHVAVGSGLLIGVVVALMVTRAGRRSGVTLGSPSL